MMRRKPKMYRRRTARMYRTVVNPLKRVNASFDENALNILTTTPVVVRLGSSQGTNDFDRIGNTVACEGIRLRGVVNHSLGGKEVFVRLAVLILRNARFDTVAGNVFDVDSAVPPSTLVGNNVIYAPFNLSQLKVPYDRMFTLGNGATTGALASCTFDTYIPLRGMKQMYEGTSVSDITQGEIRVWAVASEADDDAAAVGSVEMSFFATLMFRDA